MKYTIDNPKVVTYFRTPEDKNFTGVLKDKEGNIAYYFNGRYHREDGPAIIWSDGSIEYCLNGKSHRENGPAVIHSTGSIFYYRHGNLHRTDGPAIVYLNLIYSIDREEYWVNNKELDISTEQELKDYLMLRMFE